MGFFVNLRRLGQALASRMHLSSVDTVQRYSAFRVELLNRCTALQAALESPAARAAIEALNVHLRNVAEAESAYKAARAKSGNAATTDTVVRDYAAAVRSAVETTLELRLLLRPYLSDIRGLSRGMRVACGELDKEVEGNISAATTDILALVLHSRQATSGVAEIAGLRLVTLEDQGVRLTEALKNEAYERAAKVYLKRSFA